jgi:ABC-2 type transport system ATP-binding protein
MELLQAFGLADAAQRRFEGYSKGMKRKLTLAAGIIHRPPLLFLDEPTTGIDVAAARNIRLLIAQLHRGGTTIVLTTHYIEEAERLCARIAFLVRGRIVRVDTVHDLLQPERGRQAMRVGIAGSAAAYREPLAAAFPDLSVETASDTELRVESAVPIRVGALVRFLEEQGAEVTEARRLHPSLEDVFVRITGVEAEAMSKEKEKTAGLT